MRLEPPRPGRRRPLTRIQERTLRRLDEGQQIVDDIYGLRMEPSGERVHRGTVRALVRDGLIEDPGIPLFNPAAGRPTKHGHAYNASKSRSE